MTLNARLMHTLMRTCAAARRHPPCRGEEAPPRPRGFGRMLDALSRHSGVSQQQLAESLGIRPQSVSEAIAILESQGCIRKEVSPADRRVTLIHITDAGVQRAGEIAAERQRHAEQFFSPLTDAEKETLLALLAKLTDTKEGD